MASRVFTLILAGLMSLAAVEAADIEGNIVIKRRLTKRRITAPANSYDRGVAVELRSDNEMDPLAAERTHVVIYLDGQLPSTPVTASVEQKNRRFIPETLVVPVGSTVSFPNDDPVFHNVFSLSNPKTFDLGNYPKGRTRTVTFSKPGIVFVNCHLHPNMSAVIVVSPNRWSTKADGAGHFKLADVPPGKYTVIAWHKAAGFFRETIKIEENRPNLVQFIIPLEADEPEKEMARR
jgi:plastocyanin